MKNISYNTRTESSGGMLDQDMTPAPLRRTLYNNDSL